MGNERLTNFCVIEAQAHHCGAIVRQLRESHRAAVVRLGVNPHREMRQNFDASAFRRAWLVDGKLGAVFGVTGPLIAAHGYCWMALSLIGARYPVAIAKETRRQFEIIMQTKRDLVTTLLPEDGVSLRFAGWAGFEQVHTAPISYGTGRVIAVRYQGPSLARAA